MEETLEQKLELTDNVFELDKRLKWLVKNVEASGLLIGQLLYEISEKRLFKNLGFDTFEQYLADPELSFRRATAYNLKRIYKQWVVDYGHTVEELADVGKERLLLASKVATPETQEEWLSKARNLSFSDLKATTLVDDDEVFYPLPKFSRCPECHKWLMTGADYVCGGHGFPAPEGVD